MPKTPPPYHYERLAIHAAGEAILPQPPRYRQRLKWVPFEDYPAGATIGIFVSTTI